MFLPLNSKSFPHLLIHQHDWIFSTHLENSNRSVIHSTSKKIGIVFLISRFVHLRLMIEPENISHFWRNRRHINPITYILQMRKLDLKFQNKIPHPHTNVPFVQYLMNVNHTKICISLSTSIIIWKEAIEMSMMAILISESSNDHTNNHYFSSIFYVFTQELNCHLTFYFIFFIN